MDKIYCERCSKTYLKNAFEHHKTSKMHKRRVETQLNMARTRLTDFSNRHIAMQNYHLYNELRLYKKKCIEKTCKNLIDYDSPYYVVRCTQCSQKPHLCFDKYEHRSIPLTSMI